MATVRALFVVFFVAMNPVAEASAGAVADFTIQGVSTGETTDSARATLPSRGYTSSGGLIFELAKPSNDPLAALGYATDENIARKQVSVRDFEGKVESVVMLQIFGKNERVDADVILKQIVAVVGEPTREVRDGERHEFFFSDFPNAPNHAEAIRACEAAYAPDRPKIGSIGASVIMKVNGWVQNGEADVQKHCPGAIGAFRRYIEAQLAPQLTLTVTPGRVLLSLSEPGLRARDRRRLAIENARKEAERAKAAPVQIDF